MTELVVAHRKFGIGVLLVSLENTDFNVQESIELSEKELERTCRQQIGTSVPGNVINCFEMVRNAWNCCGDDGVVQSDTKNC